MTRAKPEAIYQAQRAGVFARLVTSERVNELDAQHWIIRWEREAEASGRLGRGGEGCNFSGGGSW